MDNVFLVPLGSGDEPPPTNFSSKCVNSTTEVYRWQVGAAAIAIVSSSLSIFGSLLIIATYLAWKDVRKSTARAIVFFLALADFGAATGYLVSSVVFFASSNKELSRRFCYPAGFWTTYFPMTSYFWTAYLAVYYVLVLVFKKDKWRIKMLIFFNLTAWLIPLAIVVPATATGWIGRGHYTLSGAWCYISDQNFDNQPIDHYEYLKNLYFFMEGICGQAWEFLTIITAITCYVLIISCNRFRWHKQTSSYEISRALSKTDLKLLLVPAIFIINKSWGSIRFVLATLPNCHSYTVNETTNKLKDLCIKQECDFVYNPFLILMQAACDLLQGFTNAILFVFLSKALCYRLLKSVWKLIRCRYCIMHRQMLKLQREQGDKHPLVGKKSTGYLVNNKQHCKLEDMVNVYGTSSTDDDWELVNYGERSEFT